MATTFFSPCRAHEPIPVHGASLGVPDQPYLLLASRLRLAAHEFHHSGDASFYAALKYNRQLTSTTAAVMRCGRWGGAGLKSE